MDFSLSSDQELIKNSARKFIENECPKEPGAGTEPAAKKDTTRRCGEKWPTWDGWVWPCPKNTAG